ncbi:unnamed protein product [Tilletia laevis]|uniref:Protein kinase domain-containing protein n=2 Tax=Tilletia TaxID=13289 RepID=A0A177V949_9BASI|nr:hypothetical protein CF336_g484 [Tilletia laevis]KAE8265403.1 hypothetical protein A4X03_0g293 [Tilletia caries]KAE8208781.1 hypothetical protein CF335_g162 [Tilletia laevis]CAD6888813.1 unnamed protein product [Tilletia caries]CAD6916457.1 unnamed protein product [Tilletia laevis]
MFRINNSEYLEGDQIASKPDEFKVVEYLLGRSDQCLRLSYAYQHMLIHVLVPRTPVTDGAAVPFETLFFDTITKTWGDPQRTNWRRRGKPQSKDQPDEVHQLEEELDRKAKALLPSVIKDHHSKGSQLFVKLDTDPTTGEVRISVVGETFRDIVHATLPFLPASMCPNVPRITLAGIDAYVTCSLADHVVLVDVVIPPATVPIRALLKTFRLPTNSKMAADHAAMVGGPLREAEILSSLPPHANVMPAPLALVTVPDPETSTDLANSEGERLVGMVLPFFSGGDASDLQHFLSVEDGLRHCYEFTSGLLHIYSHGVVMDDISMKNAVLSAPPPNNRMIVIDLEPVNMYRNLDGDPAPEVSGHWTVSMRDGQLHYSHTEARTVDADAVRSELAAMPEAIERLDVFNVGCALSQLVQCSVEFPWMERCTYDHVHIAGPKMHAYTPTKKELQMPSAFKDLVRRCCTYDPRDRPLLKEIVEVLKQWA